MPLFHFNVLDGVSDIDHEGAVLFRINVAAMKSPMMKVERRSIS